MVVGITFFKDFSFKNTLKIRKNTIVIYFPKNYSLQFDFILIRKNNGHQLGVHYMLIISFFNYIVREGNNHLKISIKNVFRVFAFLL